MPFIAQSLKNKEVLIIDKLDKSLYNFLVQYLVELFNNQKINNKGSQLIFRHKFIRFQHFKKRSNSVY